MPNSKRNRRSEKHPDENRTGTHAPGYEKLPDNPRNLPTENTSMAANDANPKYNRTEVRKDEKEQNEEKDLREGL